MRWQNLPSSTNIESGAPYTPPKSYDAALASQFEAVNNWLNRPQLTPEQQNYLNKNFPAHLSTAPIGTTVRDLPKFPTTGLMPSLPQAHFQPPTADPAQWQNTLPNVPEQPGSWAGTIWNWWPNHDIPTGMIRDTPGTTLNSMPGTQ